MKTKVKNLKTYLIIAILSLPGLLISQKKDSSFYDISAYVVLDSVMISAKRKGFDIDEFIKIIQEDKSVEIAFKNIRSQELVFSNRLNFYKSNGNILATYQSKNKQFQDRNCRRMKVLEEVVSGKYYKKKKKYRFYTAKLYDRIFYSPLDSCLESGSCPKRKTNPSALDRTIENRIDELKKLIYSHGQ